MLLNIKSLKKFFYIQRIILILLCCSISIPIVAENKINTSFLVRKTNTKRSIKKSRKINTKIVPAQTSQASKSNLKVSDRKQNSSSNNLSAKLQNIKTKYRTGEINGLQFWIYLTKLEEADSIPKNVYLDVIQQKAILLYEQHYYIAAGVYAVNVLQKIANPFSSKYLHLWKILDKVSKYKKSFYLLETLARSLPIDTLKTPPGLGSNWYYFVGNVLASQKNYNKALRVYKKLKMSDRFFIPAQYQIGIIQIENNNFNQAQTALKTILSPVVQSLSSYDTATLDEISNYAKIALARMYYQQSDFKKSIIFYRAVDRDSALFYDSLWEQAWAFFLAGYPNHALGALHSADSPFYKEQFNPEISILRAMIYYWMCRYEDSKVALSEFINNHAEEIEQLNKFLSMKNLNEQTAYMLFEDFISGVSEGSLGISKRILKTAAEQDSMKLVREQYAALISEINKFQAKGIYGNTQYSSQVYAILFKLAEQLKAKIGREFLKEFVELKKEYERLYEQSQFLYIELLMSQKEQIFGKELHADTKIDRISSKKDILGWGKNTQSWGDKAYIGEYWADEIGFYIYNVKPTCKTKY